jgi:type I restriction enzyme R subunit
MSVIQWEYDLVEKPFCEQLKAMGWQWLEGDTDVPELTERESFRDVLLKARLRTAIRKINLAPDGQPWLDEERIERAVRTLENPGGHRLMEANQAATALILNGTTIPGLSGWNEGRSQPIQYIDFDHPENNDFLVINQFKVELASGRGHIIPDGVLFVNGIPLVVGEFKSPGIESPIAQAIDQLLRYSNQRRELYPSVYTENEGLERLFHYNQILLASDFFEARAGTIAAPPEVWLEWSDPYPNALTEVAEELGLTAVAPEVEEASRELATVGQERTGRAGTPLFFRKKRNGNAQAPGTLRSQHLLVAGMLRPAHLLDLVRNFVLFQQEDCKTRKVLARYQQFRAVHKMTEKLLTGRTRAQGADRDERGGIIWHTQGSGKSLSMVFTVRKMRTMDRLKHFKVVAVTDRTDLERQLRETAALTGETVRPNDHDIRRGEAPTARTQRILHEATPDIVFAMIQKYQVPEDLADERGGAIEAPAEGKGERVRMTIVKRERKPGTQGEIMAREVTYEENIHFEEFPVLNESENILVMVDEAHRGHTRTLHRNLRRALPNAAIVGFTGTPIFRREKQETRDIFGNWIDRYVLHEAEEDGATVPILYEGRTADGFVKDAPTLDQLFEDMFRNWSQEDLAVIKAKYGTAGDVLEAPMLIEKKARDMMRHYVGVVMPEGYKAQVVAVSRRAATIYREALEQARRELVAELEALPPRLLTLSDEDLEREDREAQFLVRAYSRLPMLRAIEIAVVMSGDHNDPESWGDWTDGERQEEHISRFKRKLAPQKTEKTDPLAILVVKAMLLTGFDAPVEQVMYLDRKMVGHDLLQAIARVNRTSSGTSGPKPCGYIVDYVGVARHLNEALADYDGKDVEGTLIDINVELPKLRDRHARAVAVFTDQGIRDLMDVEACVDLLADLRVRADFINKLREFYETLNIIEHRPEVSVEIFRDAKLLGFINKVAANLYRDPTLNLLGVPEKVRALIDAHVSARGVDPKIPPVKITDADFEKVLGKHKSNKARATEMQHAARYHIIETENPAFARKMSEKLEAILQKFKDDWDALERELRQFIAELRRGDVEFPDLDARKQVPFVRLVLEEAAKGKKLTDDERRQLIGLTLDMVERIRQEIRIVGFWRNLPAREQLTRRLVRDLDAVAAIIPPDRHRDLAQQLVALAKHNHETLTRNGN